MYRTLNLTSEYTFFSACKKQFSRILSHEMKLNKFKIIEIIEKLIFTELKPEISNIKNEKIYLIISFPTLRQEQLKQNQPIRKK